MRFKASTKPEIEPNITRLLLKFAWFPVRIADQIVWLETYQQLQVFEVVLRKVVIDSKQHIFENGKWVNLAKRCN